MVNAYSFASISLFLFFVFVQLLQQPVSAYPTGTGGCSGKNGSVGSSHLEGPILVTGHLALCDYQVELLDTTTTSSSGGTGKVLKHDATATTTIKVGTPYIIKVSSTTGSNSTDFGGFLFRLADPLTGEDTASFLTVPQGYAARGLAQTADVCTNMNIAGITHTGENSLSEMGVDMLVDTPMKLELQVTLVFDNCMDDGEHRSVYHWDTYMLDAVESSSSGSVASKSAGSTTSGLVSGSSGANTCAFSLSFLSVAVVSGFVVAAFNFPF